MTTADHTPSRNCYLRGCRRPECELENYRYSKQLKLEHSRGERRMQDTAEVRAHIELLLAAKWWQAEIARAAGVSRSNLQKIVNGTRCTHKHTALAILSVPVVPILRTKCGDRVPAIGSTRRLQALAVLGHPWMDVSTHTGITSDRLGAIARAVVDVLRPDEARKITAAYRVLSTKPGRMKQIATYAVNKGWSGPFAWDDIDDPQCEPERAKPYAASKKYVQDPDRKREIEHLYLLGESPEQIAKQLGGNEKYIGDQLGAVLRERAKRAGQEKTAKARLEAAA